MTTVDAALRAAAASLDAVGARWAVIGGVAVSFRTEPRSTRDVDFAIAAADDDGAENLIFHLRSHGYRDYNPPAVFEQDHNGRLSTMRLVGHRSDVAVDLLFASSGIEAEIVASATRLEVLPRVKAPVASTGHLIAMKVLAGRNKDLDDLENLIAAASPADLAVAREAVRLIQTRGYSHGQNLPVALERHIREGRR
jgi:predicted nucleotidyltransferase